MYNILTSKYKDEENKINVDLIPELRHPKSILFGGGSLQVKYTNYLETEVFKNVSLLRRFVSLNKTGTDKGTIALVCDCKIGKKDNREAHSIVIKNFLIKYNEYLSNLIPYLFNTNDEINKTDQETENDLRLLSEDLKIALASNINTNKLINNVNGKNIDKLSDDDKNQIKNLLAQQMGNPAIQNMSFDELIGGSNSVTGIDPNTTNDIKKEEPEVLEYIEE